MSTSTQRDSSGPQPRSGPMITGGAFVAVGSLIALGGVAVSGAHLLSAARRWIRDLEVAPGEVARTKWEQARAAAAAGTAAWRNGA